jgi:5-oxoprolinase (ATP-hydrolysing)
VILGRLLPDYFPRIFGKSENEPLDLVATTRAFEKLAESINFHLVETNANKVMTMDEIAYGFVRVANEV